MTNIIEAQTCAWCEPNGTQVKCHNCKNGCRQAKLRNRTWNFKVTPDTGLAPYVVSNNVNFEAINGCCDRITAFPRSAPNDRSTTSEIYKWRRYGRTYSQIVERTRVCTNPTLGTCHKIGPLQVCSWLISYAKACVLGWKQVALITTASLYISRTQPRYGCGEENECRYRLALVVEGQIGVTWATQITEGQSNILTSTNTFCGIDTGCDGAPTQFGVWPVGSPPPFNADIVSVTLHNFRQVLRRSVDKLEFPMVFNQENNVGSSCGPQCAASITGVTPTFASPPDFECTAPPDLPGSVGGGIDAIAEDCVPISCAEMETYCGSSSGAFVQDFTTQQNTLTGSSDSGVVTPGLMPATTLPQSYTVELY